MGKTARRSLVKSFVTGLSSYLRVPGTLLSHHLWPMQLIPAGISLLLAMALFSGIWLGAAGFSQWMDNLISIPIQWLDRTLAITMSVLSFLILLASFYFLHKHLALVILAPFLGLIAEKTLEALRGEEFVKSNLGTTASIARSVKINLRYIGREILANIAFLFCGLIPGIGSILSASGMFLTQAKFLGYGLMDFPLENRGLTVAESDQFVKERTGLSLGIGAGYLLLMTIPFIGWMFAPTFGTVAGTLVAMEELESN